MACETPLEGDKVRVYTYSKLEIAFGTVFMYKKLYSESATRLVLPETVTYQHFSCSV